MYTLYSMQRSGNSYKVRLALARLGIPYKLVEVDILKGESRTPESQWSGAVAGSRA
jgi:glutathione S-transferase